MGIFTSSKTNNYFSSYIDIKAISAPSSPNSGIGRLFYNTSTGKLSFKKSNGTVVDLESGGGGGTVESASNVGLGSGWFKTLNGTDLEFKSLIAGSNQLSITSNTNDLTLDVVEANIKLDDLGAPDDNTDLNASTLKHGLLPKLSGNSTDFLTGQGTWAVPAGGGAGGGTFGDTETQDGDASTTIFTIAHGLGVNPNAVSVEASSIDALGDYQVDHDDTNITITYQSAPPSGTGNLVWIWIASVGGSGEANTYSNAGAGGVGIVLTKTGVDFPFKSINTADSNNITVTNDAGNSEIDIDIGSAVMTASSTHTMTNKTFNADGTGNSISNIENADIKAAAGIAYSKLTLTNSVVNADVNTTAGIVYSKLNLTDSIVDADINSAAAIVTSKLADANNFLLTTNTKTVTNKTIDSINNTMKNLGAPAYEVFTDATNWYARNTKTGAITSTNTSLTTVLQAAIDALTGGRTSKETVKVKGDGSIAKITIPSYTTLDLRDAKLTLIALTQDHMLVNSDTVGGNTQIDIIGGYLDGNNDGGQGTVGTGDEDLKNIIHLQNVTDSFVLYTYITDTVCRGVRLRDSSNCVVAYNTINDTGAEGIQTRGGLSNKILFNDLQDTNYSWITTYQTPNTIIHGNYCDTIVNNGTSGFNISSFRAIVSENRLYNNGNSVISLSEAASTHECSGTHIINNYLHGSRSGGGIIGVGYVFKDLIISGNEIYDCAAAGIRISGQHQGVVIINNVIHDNQHSGINAGGTAGSSTDPRDILIAGNICYNNGKGLGADVERAGITIFGTDAAGIIDTIVTNNICYDTQGTKTQKYGIRAVNTDNCIITNNMVRGNLTDGMILTTNTNLVHYNNKGYASDNTVVTLTETQTLTNKTLTSPVISTISNSGTITLPTGTRTLVARDTTDTLTNKTLTAPTINDLTASGTMTIGGAATAGLTISKTAVGSAAEKIMEFLISDDVGSSLSIENASGGDAIFSPMFICKQSSTATAGLFVAQGTTDTGTQPLFVISGRIGSGTPVATRPIFAIQNQTSSDRLMIWNPSNVTFKDTYNIVFNTTTGTKIGTATTQKLSFWNATPITQPAGIADVDAGTVNSGDAATDTVITDMRTKLNSVITKLESLGLIATV